MKISFDLFVWSEDGKKIIFNHLVTLTEEDLVEMLTQQFREGRLPCPMSSDCETVKVSIDLNTVTV